MKTVWFNLNGIGADERFGPIYQRLSGRSPWALRWAAVAAGLVFVVPFVLLAIAAALTFILVFGVLSVVERARLALAGLFAGRRGEGDDGRRNVTVVRVDDRL